MFRIFIIAGIITGICAESSTGRFKAYDYNGSYSSYPHGKSDKTETSVTSQVISSGGFSPSDGKYAVPGSSASRESFERGVSTNYISSPTTPAYGTKYPTPAHQASNYDNFASYKSPYTSTSSTSSAIYSPPNSYSSTNYIPISTNSHDYTSSSSATVSGFTGNSDSQGGSGSYGDYPSQAGYGLGSYAVSGIQSANQGSAASDYTTSISGSNPSGYLSSSTDLGVSSHSNLGGHVAGTHIGSSYAGYATSSNPLRSHIGSSHNYINSGANVVSHEYSVAEPDVTYGSTIDAHRYSVPIHSSELIYKDTGYASANPSLYGNIKGSYTTSGIGGHIGSYSSPASPTYIRISESPVHGGSAHYPSYAVSPSFGYSPKSSTLSQVPGIFGSTPTKIIYVKDSSLSSSSYPGSYNGGSYKNKIYGLHGAHYTSAPTYAAAPSNNLITGYLAKGYGGNNHNNLFLSYP